MKTLFTFRAKDNPMSVKEMTELPRALRHTVWLQNPRATHVVITKNKMILAICGSELDARVAKDRLDNFKTIQ